MNDGKDVWTAMREIALPDELAVGEAYGRLDWSARAIWESYAGWFHQHSTLDLYGRGFVLVRFGQAAPEDQKLVEAANARGVPIHVEAIDNAEAAAIYETRLVLVRPDGHVAWRGNDAPNDALAVIDRARGA